MKKTAINDYIVADPAVCHGKPVFIGTRIMVVQIVEMLMDGAKIADINCAFPALTSAHISSALFLTRGR
jgi:uncharacterized protein (DUF433 family)